MRAVDLKAKPYFLQDEDIAWVRSTIAGMSQEEKVGQLFFAILANGQEEYLKKIVDCYHVAGCRYNAGPGEAVWQQLHAVQQYSRLPLLIAANTESGGDNARRDGTSIGSGIKIAATGNAEHARELGRYANEQAAAVGCNMAFAPVCDIAYNWQNTEIINRAFGSDPKRVAEMSAAYLRGAHEVPGFACAAKHFPGNGMDFRDAHLSDNINPMTPEQWDASYGMVYKTLFDEGLEAVMAGHIMLPEYARAINPDLTDGEQQPATLSAEIMTGLLRDRMGFNGVVVTDATHMVGMSCRMKRSELLPRCINAGCDLLLFFNDPDEDFGWVLDAYRSGVICEERMNEALTRILGLKAHLGLHKKAPQDRTLPAGAVEATRGRPEYAAARRAVSQEGITLVKYLDEGVLPITPEKYPRILLSEVTGVEDGMTALMKLVGMAGGTPVEALKQKLEAKGFEVAVYENPLDKMKKQLAAGGKPDLNLYFAGKDAIADFTAQMDLVLTVCNVASGRPCYRFAKGGAEIPWFVHEVPTVAVSCGSPTMLADMPQVRTYINAYDAGDETLDILVEKLMQGPQAFCGNDPIDSFCGLPDTRL